MPSPQLTTPKQSMPAPIFMPSSLNGANSSARTSASVNWAETTVGVVDGVSSAGIAGAAGVDGLLGVSLLGVIVWIVFDESIVFGLVLSWLVGLSAANELAVIKIEAKIALESIELLERFMVFLLGKTEATIRFNTLSRDLTNRGSIVLRLLSSG